ncbi:superoxide dismutase [Mn], mitochondrial-like [Platysternon megacephalum]|uniref:Superoxide dismutase [Mn], mitochondrial-like n=1 Tax=Platysternon megacephalum TaxID=55544 RepID=A0A4D9EJR8_9SAUR|nr:superoxide dismutase [Mn], mitochondrial-like [Platysternon megacephalum]
MGSTTKQPYTKCAACWLKEHSWILVNPWSEASKTFDFSKSTRNEHVCKSVSEQLRIHQITNQCWEQTKSLKTDYHKTRDDNCTSGNSSSTYLFYKEFDQVLGTAQSTEPTVVHDNLLSREGSLITPHSQVPPDDSLQIKHLEYP